MYVYIVIYALVLFVRNIFYQLWTTQQLTLLRLRIRIRRIRHVMRTLGLSTGDGRLWLQGIRHFGFSLHITWRVTSRIDKGFQHFLAQGLHPKSVPSCHGHPCCQLHNAHQKLRLIWESQGSTGPKCLQSDILWLLLVEVPHNWILYN